ncbi:MAG: DUF1559 domain-containing protein [Isosphaeraceae bacterium]
MALQAYLSMHGHLPAGTEANPSLPPERRLSWLAALASYWDYGGLYNDIDRAAAWDSPHNAPLAGLNYLTDYEPYPDDRLKRGLSPYVGIAGVGRDAALLPVEHPRAGAFGYDRVTAARDIRDGAGATIIVVETGRDNGPWLAGGPPTVRALDPGRGPYLGRGRQFGGVRVGSAVALFADGSVRPVSDSIEPRVFEAIATIAGGEALPDVRTIRGVGVPYRQ